MLLLLFFACLAQAKFDYTIMYKSPSLYKRIQNGRREKILMDNNCGKESRCEYFSGLYRLDNAKCTTFEKKQQIFSIDLSKILHLAMPTR